MPPRDELVGQPASSGRAVGVAVHLQQRPSIPPRTTAAQVLAALEAVASELEDAAREADGDLAGILVADAATARDPLLVDELARQFEAHPVDLALEHAFATLAATLEAAGGVIAERAADLAALERRLRTRLAGETTQWGPGVVVADELGPLDLLALESTRPCALVLAGASSTAHIAIVARSLGLPAATGVHELERIPQGATVLVDGTSGRVVVDPDPAELAVRATASPRPNPTDGGIDLALLANVTGPRDVAHASELGTHGIGLLRTEFLFLGLTQAPDLATQARTYEELVAPFSGARCVVRTLDVGADKPLPFLPLPPVPNPALGVRGWRAHAISPALLETQLAAIARARKATRADVAVMAPMVTTVDEAAAFVALARRFDLPAGVMVEVPALALMGAELATVVDFVFLGTNDLAQYLCAVDREVAMIAPLADPFSPALSRLIERLLTDVAGRIPIGVCGELAADPLGAVVLAGLGATSLSMNPRAIPTIRATLAAVTVEQARQIARAVLGAPSASEATRRADEMLQASLHTAS